MPDLHDQEDDITEDAAFDAGYKCAEDGMFRYANPYEDRALRRAWYAGFDEATDFLQFQER